MHVGSDEYKLLRNLKSFGEKKKTAEVDKKKTCKKGNKRYRKE